MEGMEREEEWRCGVDEMSEGRGCEVDIGLKKL